MPRLGSSPSTPRPSAKRSSPFFPSQRRATADPLAQEDDGVHDRRSSGPLTSLAVIRIQVFAIDDEEDHAELRAIGCVICDA